MLCIKKCETFTHSASGDYEYAVAMNTQVQTHPFPSESDHGFIVDLAQIHGKFKINVAAKQINNESENDSSRS